MDRIGRAKPSNKMCLLHYNFTKSNVKIISKLTFSLFTLLGSKSGIKFGIKFKPMPHSGWKDRMNAIHDVWVEELALLSSESDTHTG